MSVLVEKKTERESRIIVEVEGEIFEDYDITFCITRSNSDLLNREVRSRCECIVYVQHTTSYYARIIDRLHTIS